LRARVAFFHCVLAFFHRVFASLEVTASGGTASVMMKDKFKVKTSQHPDGAPIVPSRARGSFAADFDAPWVWFDPESAEMSGFTPP